MATVSFKVYLHHEADASYQEIRRFGIDSDVVTNYIYLREKLQNIFPNIRGKRFEIFWKGNYTYSNLIYDFFCNTESS